MVLTGDEYLFLASNSLQNCIHTSRKETED